MLAGACDKEFLAYFDKASLVDAVRYITGGSVAAVVIGVSVGVVPGILIHDVKAVTEGPRRVETVLLVGGPAAR